jgi:hypothetical protein
MNIKNLISEYEACVSSAKLSKQYKISTQKILRTLRENGVKIRSKGGTVKKYDEGWSQHFINSYINGEPINDIAKRMGVGYGTVMRSLKGVKKKTKWFKKNNYFNA